MGAKVVAFGEPECQSGWYRWCWLASTISRCHLLKTVGSNLVLPVVSDGPTRRNAFRILRANLLFFLLSTQIVIVCVETLDSPIRR
jgi:hypothetical protein